MYSPENKNLLLRERKESGLLQSTIGGLLLQANITYCVLKCKYFNEGKGTLSISNRQKKGIILKCI